MLQHPTLSLIDYYIQFYLFTHLQHFILFAISFDSGLIVIDSNLCVHVSNYCRIQSRWLL